MDKNYIYIADSNILPQKGNQQIYSILCMCGSEKDVLQFAATINNAFENLDVETQENIANWISDDDNMSKFMECLNVKNEMSKLRLSCLISNHSFAMMISYLKAVTESLDISNLDITRTVESIYPEFEKKCIPLFLENIDIDVTNELSLGLKKCLSNSQETKGKNTILKSLLPIQIQFKNVKDLCDKLFSDISMSDYIQYMNIFEKINNDCQISHIFATDHSNKSLRKSITIKSIVEQTKPIVADLAAIKPFDNERIKRLFEKFISINDYAWNRLSTEVSSKALTENEKYLIMSLWILFMGDYSSWMLSNMEYKRLSSIFEELRNK